MPWVRVSEAGEQLREEWFDDGAPLSRYDYLTILVRGYGAIGKKAPEELLAELRVEVDAEVARLEELRRAEEWRKAGVELRKVYPYDPAMLRAVLADAAAELGSARDE